MGGKRTLKKEASIYINDFHRRETYFGLLGTAIRYFKSAYIIKEFANFKNKLNLFCSQPVDRPHEWPIIDFSEYAQEDLIDSIKISICFENYLKGRLILNRYLVHLIDTRMANKQFKSLGNIYENPIRMSQYKAIEGIVQDPIDGTFYFRGLKEQTVFFSSLLDKPLYQKVLPLPLRIRSLVKDWYLKRNRLHLNYSGGIVYTNNTLPELVHLINFVNKQIIRKYNKLVDRRWQGNLARRYETEIPT